MTEMRATMAEAIKAEFRTLCAEWFVDDCKNDGPCEMTPWVLLAEAALKVMREPTETMVAEGVSVADYVIPTAAVDRVWCAMVEEALK